MKIWNSLFGSKNTPSVAQKATPKPEAVPKSAVTGLFANLTLEEKRTALDFDEFYLQSLLDARQGKAHVVEVGFKNKFVERMSDSDIREAIELTRLQKRPIAASEAGNPREVIRYFEQICAKAPFDSTSIMSMGVQYAYLRDGRKAVENLERALRSDPGNQRIRNNLQAIRQDFRL